MRTAALDAFMNAFGDGHAYVDWKNNAKPPATGTLCERLGYKAREPGGIDFARLDGYLAIDDIDFPGGILAALQLLEIGR